MAPVRHRERRVLISLKRDLLRQHDVSDRKVSLRPEAPDGNLRTMVYGLYGTLRNDFGVFRRSVWRPQVPLGFSFSFMTSKPRHAPGLSFAHRRTVWRAIARLRRMEHDSSAPRTLVFGG